MSEERPWLPINGMPIGDNRGIIVELRSGELEALGYWSGSKWAFAPVTAEPRTIGFQPLEYRMPLPSAETAAEEPAAPPPPAALPAGEYAIVEIMGHRTIVGRVEEVERFGAKLMSIQPVFAGGLLDAVLIGGGSIYQFTPCSAATALARQPREGWQLPSSIRAAMPPAMLPAPEAEPGFEFVDDDDDRSF